jgi:hypothetical protein
MGNITYDPRAILERLMQNGSGEAFEKLLKPLVFISVPHDIVQAGRMNPCGDE